MKGMRGQNVDGDIVTEPWEHLVNAWGKLGETETCQVWS